MSALRCSAARCSASNCSARRRSVSIIVFLEHLDGPRHLADLVVSLRCRAPPRSDISRGKFASASRLGQGGDAARNAPLHCRKTTAPPARPRPKRPSLVNPNDAIARAALASLALTCASESRRSFASFNHSSERVLICQALSADGAIETMVFEPLRARAIHPWRIVWPPGYLMPGKLAARLRSEARLTGPSR